MSTNDSMSYKINIQQGWPDTTLIVPSNLEMNARRVLITMMMCTEVPKVVA
jgi:hypothetical protein